MRVRDEFEYDNTTNSEGDIRFYSGDETNTTSFDHNVDFGLQAEQVLTVLNHIALDVTVWR